MQGAYDSRRPNSTHRRPAGGREAIHVYRLYRKLSAAPRELPSTGSIFAPIRAAIRNARTYLAQAQDFLTGRVLELEIQLPLIVEGFERTTEMRTAFTYTQAGYFLDTPFANAKGVTHFQIRGRTHWTPVSVNGVLVDGESALKEFSELIDDYFFPTDGRTTADYELYFLDLNAAASAEDPFGETEWLIHPTRGGVRQQQVSQRPFTRFWQFSFIGLQSNRDKAKAADGFLDSLTSTGVLGKILDELGLGGLKQALDDFFGVIEETQAFVDDMGNLVVAVQDAVRGAVDFVRGGIGRVRGLINSAKGFVGRIQAGIDYLKSIPDLIGDDFNALIRDFPGLGGGDSTPGLVAQDELRKALDFLYALNAQPQLFAPEVASGQQTEVIAVKPGQTIEQIAAEVGVSVETLVEVNELAFPFVDARPDPAKQRAHAERVLAAARAAQADAQAALDAAVGTAPADIASLERTVERLAATAARAEQEIADLAATAAPRCRVLPAGAQLKVPRPSRAPSSVIDLTPELRARVAALTGRSPDEEDRLFGFDLALDGGSLVWDAQRRDLALERGTHHMLNVQVRYVRLPAGSLRYAPRLGNLAFEHIGKWAGPANNRLLAYALYSTLSQDPRIRRVRNVVADYFGGVAQLTYDAELVNGATLPEIRVPLQ